ncbi:hypothetical protein [Haloferula sp. BvORR071]|uniref:hypothetical protein n=1 Tax=Haloferula sp. BvORR071 TaxID=1396141 RepID=UPI0005510C11|nr:hypothetical protein [Haloferula sp. BvORR071]
MKRKPGIAALILAISAGLAWHNHQQLAVSRATRDKLLDQAASRGITVDPQNPTSVILPSKLPRPNREEETRQLATSFIAYIDEMRPKAGSLDASDPALREKITHQMDQLLGLDAGQWEMLIREVFTRTDHPPTYQGLIGLALRQLAKDHPDRALAVLLDTQGLLDTLEWMLPLSVVSETTRQMVARDPQAALDWFTANRAKLRPDLLQSATRDLIAGIGKQDPRQALKLIDEFKPSQPEALIPMILARTTPEERNSSLAVLREWQVSRQAPAGDKAHRGALEVLAFGLDSSLPDRHGEYTPSAAWMAQADLTTEEYQIIGENLTNRIDLKDGGQWIEWLHEHLDEETARDQSQNIFSQWLSTDYEAVGHWLEEHPDSPDRDRMVHDLVERISLRDPELAARFAQGSPEKSPQEPGTAEGAASVGMGSGVGPMIGNGEAEQSEK